MKDIVGFVSAQILYSSVYGYVPLKCDPNVCADGRSITHKERKNVACSASRNLLVAAACCRNPTQHFGTDSHTILASIRIADEADRGAAIVVLVPVHQAPCNRFCDCSIVSETPLVPCCCSSAGRSHRLNYTVSPLLMISFDALWCKVSSCSHCFIHYRIHFSLLIDAFLFLLFSGQQLPQRRKHSRNRLCVASQQRFLSFSLNCMAVTELFFILVDFLRQRRAKRNNHYEHSSPWTSR